jgi:IS605 OrfB family transposase
MVATKTIRQKLAERPRLAEWFSSTKTLYNQVASFYFDVIQAHPAIIEMNIKEATLALETITHATADHPEPVMSLAEAVAPGIPAMFRRAAISAALGSAKSFYSNLKRWQKEKDKHEAKNQRLLASRKPVKKFKAKPPVPPRTWNKSVVFYAGMWKDRTDKTIVLKLWDAKAKTWRWVKVNVLSNRELPKDGDWELGSPQAVNKRGKAAWWLHTPIQKKVVSNGKIEKQVKEAQQRTRETENETEENPSQTEQQSLRLCSVDLNINDSLTVCTILNADGKVVASRFIRGGNELQHRRKLQLGRVARKRSQTKGTLPKGIQDNKQLWEKVRNIDDNAAHLVSRRIVEFAVEQSATILVFEHLGNFKPQKGKYSKRGNEKRSYWLRGRIFKYAKYKAWAAGGIITSRVSPRDTSRECCRCHAKPVARYNFKQGGEPVQGYTPGAPLFLCPVCQLKGNADHNAARNIGQRLLARYGVEFVYDGSSSQNENTKEKPQNNAASGSSSHGRSQQWEGVNSSYDKAKNQRELFQQLKLW